GQIALPTPRRHRPRQKTVTWITSEESRAEVQRLRHAADALLTGIGTVLADDPRLTDRTDRPRRRRLLRVVMDSRLRLPLKSKLAKSAEGDVLVFTTQPADSLRARALRRAGVEVARVRSRDTRPDLRAVVEELGRRDRKSTRLNSSHGSISYAVFCLKKKNTHIKNTNSRYFSFSKRSVRDKSSSIHTPTGASKTAHSSYGNNK